MRSRLPERLSGAVPPALVEVGIGLAVAALSVALRSTLAPLIGPTTPYVFNFAGVAIAAIIAGWRSGLVTLATAQTLTWFTILEPHVSVPRENHQLGGFIASSISMLILLATIALYQREVDKSSANREQRLQLLDEALKEIDHRTRNNYQNVLAMIRLQAQRSSSGDVRAALEQVADRIDAIAKASQRLAVDSAAIGEVRLEDHLCGLIKQIERGIAREEIKVECDVEDVTATSEKATSISIIVNELVTNAIKHAFNGVGSGSVWVTGKSGSPFELTIADNGRGISADPARKREGLGSRLVESFARQLGAQHEVRSSDEGTVHRLLIPSLQ